MRQSKIRDAAIALAEQGAAIVRLRPKSKRPFVDRWQSLPRATPAELRREMLPDENFGVRFGRPSQIAPRRWLYGIDADLLDRENLKQTEREAWGALLDALPGCDEWPRSVSGSGGPSFHLWFQSDGIFRKCNIARSPRRIMTKGDIERPAWELDLFGTGTQMVCAPSIHPVTEREYEWWSGKPPVLADLPFVRAPRLEKLFEKRVVKRDRGDREPESLRSLHNILSTKACANTDLEYDDWLKTLFAIKTEYAGTDLEDEALSILEEWSEQSYKHDRREFERIWSAAKADYPGGVTLGTLKKRAAPELEERLQESIAAEMQDRRPTLPNGGETAPAAARSADPDDWWKGRPIYRDKNGDPKNCGHNRTLVIEHHPDLQHLVWSTDDGAPVWRKPDDVMPRHMRALTFGKESELLYDPGTDYQVVENYLRFDPLQLDSPGKEPTNDSVYLAVKKRPWSRLKELLTLIEWDGVPRVEHLLQDYLGVEDNEYSRQVSRLLVVGPMCRVLNPGIKIDFAPILQGDQGIGKDRFFEILCTFNGVNFYTAATFDMSKPAEYMHVIKGKLIVHFSEMTTFNRHDVETCKQFITHTEDCARLAYGRGLTTIKRTAIFVGSTNQTSDILRDPTGNRRFLPIQCGDPDKDANGKPRAYKRDFDELERVQRQIWAEARVLAQAELEDRSVHVRGLTLSTKALAIAGEKQEEQRAESPEEILAAQGQAALDEPVDYDDILPRSKRNKTTARQKGIRNQVSAHEFWCEVLRKKDQDFPRNTVLCARALGHVKGWSRLPAKQLHLDRVVRVYRRDGTDGSPKIIDDCPNVGDKEPIKFEDAHERIRRRRDA